MPEREVRYCTTEDGVRIAYCLEGNGPALVVFPWGLASFALTHLVPAYEQFLATIGKGRQLVFWDSRGVGMSERRPHDLSPAALLRDLDAVVSAVGLERFSVFAMTDATPHAIQYAARERRISRLVLHAAYTRPDDMDPRALGEALAGLARANWELAVRTILDGVIRRSEEVGLASARWIQESASGETMARFIEGRLDLDVSDEVPRVSCPTLIVNRQDMPNTAPAQRLAALLPNPRFVPVGGPAGGLFYGDWPPVAAAVNAFLDEDPETRALSAKPAEPVDSAFRTVLIADLVGHTKMMSRLGDDRGRSVLREH